MQSRAGVRLRDGVNSRLVEPLEQRWLGLACRSCTKGGRLLNEPRRRRDSAWFEATMISLKIFDRPGEAMAHRSVKAGFD
jgi:hypothetical protein